MNSVLIFQLLRFHACVTFTPFPLSLMPLMLKS